MLSQREFSYKKSENFSEWYNNIIYASELVDNRYNLQGFLVHKPRGAFLVKYITRLFEEELDKTKHEAVLFPIVIPKDNFEKEKQHLKGFAPELFWITKMGDQELAKPFALRPTSETAFYQMYSLWIRSPSDLPLKYYQSGSVYRAEKETNPFLRGREFYWIETHCAFQTLKEAENQLHEDQKIFTKIVKEKLGLNFLVFDRPEWDKFAGADKTIAFDTILPDGKVLQFGTTHLLGQHFSKPFEIKSEGEYVYQTCFGPGIWRIIAAIVSIHGDDKGLKLPSCVSKIQIIIIPVGKNDKTETLKNIAANLKEFRVEVDDSNKTFGWKLNQSEMLGIPIRIEVGDRELEAGQVTLFDRFSGSKKQVKLEAIEKEVSNLISSQEEQLSQNATELSFYDAKSLQEIKEGGIARIPFIDVEGEEAEKAAKELQEKTGYKIRGILYGKPELAGNAKCIITGKPAKYFVYAAKQY